MDIEQQQAEHIEHFVKQASIINDSPSSLVNVIVEATSHPSLFAFTEILSVPNILELQGTEDSRYLDLLQMFAHGTVSEFNSNASKLPQLIPDQVLKLKQLTMLTLAKANKVLSYDMLMHELDVVNVRELEDFLINECMYVGIIRGKLDQQRSSFEVQFAIGRDLRPGQLGNMIHTLSNWLGTSDNLLITIQQKIKWADLMGELYKKHKQENIEMLEGVKNALSLQVNTALFNAWFDQFDFYVDHDFHVPCMIIILWGNSELGIFVSCIFVGALYLHVAEVMHYEQADMDFRAPDGITYYGQDRRSKRRRHGGCLQILEPDF